MVLQQDEALPVTFVVFARSSGTASLFFSVKDFQREDGKPVDDEAGCLGVERRGFFLRGKSFQHSGIDAFDQVVAVLVQAVDVALGLDDGCVGGVGISGLVFPVPEIKISAVLLEDERINRCTPDHDGLMMPIGGSHVVVANDIVSVEHKRWGHESRKRGSVRQCKRSGVACET